MKKTEKRPIRRESSPEYPLKSSYCPSRRRFIAVAGLAAVATGLPLSLSSCGELGLYTGRLPAKDSRSSYTFDGGDLGYVVHTRHEYKRFSEYLVAFEEEILVTLDRVLASYSVDDLSEQDSIGLAQSALMAALEDGYAEQDGSEAGIIDLELEIVRLQKTDGPDGMAADRVR